LKTTFDNLDQNSSQANTRFGSGQAVKRVEDQLLLLGAGQYTNDVSLPGQARLVFLRSPYPHAKIKAIDTQAAKAMPGVHGIFTGDELLAAGIKPMARPLNFKRADGGALSSTTRHILAIGTVRFVGEPIVAVVADTEEQAQNAAEAVYIDFDPLPSASRLSDALAPSAPLFTDAPDNRVAETRYGDAAATQAAFDQAAHVVHLNIVNQRLAALSIEPRSVLAYPENGRLNIRMSSQMPTGVRTAVCDVIGLDKENVRVIVGDVGVVLA